MAKTATKVTVLGSGTSTGIPRMFCSCRVCRSKNPKNHRLRASIWIQSKTSSLLVDASPDLRIQAMRAKIPRLDAVWITHAHADHVSGIDELRSFNFIQRAPIPIYGNRATLQELKTRYHYIFDKKTPTEGGGVAQLVPKVLTLKPRSKPIHLGRESFQPIRYDHGSWETVGIRTKDFAYLPDCSPPASRSTKKTPKSERFNHRLPSNPPPFHPPSFG